MQHCFLVNFSVFLVPRKYEALSSIEALFVELRRYFSPGPPGENNLVFFVLVLVVIISTDDYYYIVSFERNKKKETYRKIPIISPGLIFVQKVFWGSLCSEGLIIGRNFALGLTIKTATTNSPWAYIREGSLSEGFLRLRFGGRIFGRASFGGEGGGAYYRNFTVYNKSQV